MTSISAHIKEDLPRREVLDDENIWLLLYYGQTTQ